MRRLKLYMSVNKTLIYVFKLPTTMTYFIIILLYKLLIKKREQSMFV